MKGEYSSSNNRVLNLLDELRLGEFVWNDGLSLEEIVNSKVDWIMVEERLDVLRQKSKEFLIGALEM